MSRRTEPCKWTAGSGSFGGELSKTRSEIKTECCSSREEEGGREGGRERERGGGGEGERKRRGGGRGAEGQEGGGGIVSM